MTTPQARCHFMKPMIMCIYTNWYCNLQFWKLHYMHICQVLLTKSRFRVQMISNAVTRSPPSFSPNSVASCYNYSIYCDVPGSPCLSKTGPVYGPFFFFSPPVNGPKDLWPSVLSLPGALGGLLETPPRRHVTIYKAVFHLKVGMDGPWKQNRQRRWYTIWK